MIGIQGFGNEPGDSDGFPERKRQGMVNKGVVKVWTLFWPAQRKCAIVPLRRFRRLSCGRVKLKFVCLKQGVMVPAGVASKDSYSTVPVVSMVRISGLSMV